VKATQQPVSPQPLPTGDRISLLRLAEHVSRNVGAIPAVLAIREKWRTGALQFWVQWIFGHSFGTSREAFISLGEEAVPPYFLHDLEERGLPAPPSPLNDDPGLTFRTIINASEVGIYLADRPGCLFKSLVEDVDDDSAACIFTSRAAAAQHWPWLDDKSTLGDQSSTRKGRRSPRGAKTAWDWEVALIEACVFIIERGLPEKQVDLVEHVAQWFGNDGPGDSQIKAHVAPLYRKAKQALSR
jgi:hypothetical protein